MRALGQERKRIQADWLVAIYAALDAGYDVATIARAAGVSHQRVSQIKQERKRVQSSQQPQDNRSTEK